MKLLKNIAASVVAATLYVGYFTSCQQAAPTPDAGNAVSIKPPSPVVNPLACETVKNPAEEIEWIKKLIVSHKEKQLPLLITQYDYQNRKVYHYGSVITGLPSVFYIYCDGKVLTYSGGITPANNYFEVQQNVSNPVVVVDFK